ncbi:MAG: hypothetical protein HN778_13465 [Prolixibacteraceae bacterium]|jgi:hypothetical protein|nr:hypothetical protein [Prolixibacteraceae bacterium]MBT6766867.1 hypothetical protein [Prolixibacteraceae bacterium]MBT7000837.1 hypothetical protein [Prolixibacteraceae bacterium]MBT7395835.1 hypothetical protein [Prolixibacteraceae bacterium]
MKNKLFWIAVLLILFSCSKETDEKKFEIKKGTGTVWLSGGLAFCATQIRMDSGDTLIPVNEQILFYQGGQQVRISFSELEIRESGCSIGKDCEIIEITVIE